MARPRRSGCSRSFGPQVSCTPLSLLAGQDACGVIKGVESRVEDGRDPTDAAGAVQRREIGERS